jgi:beta-glucosidase
MLEGKYTDAYLREAGQDAPKFTDEDLRVIASPLDFIGINVYKPAFYALASDQAPGWREAPFARSHPTMFSRWLSLDPEALSQGERRVVPRGGAAQRGRVREDGGRPAGDASRPGPTRGAGGGPSPG